MVKITSYGAAGEVTGSRHVVSFDGGKILLDCGMFQGSREKVGERNKELGFNVSEVDAVVLSHGHLDHCGSLPTLLKTGYTGKVYCSAPTADVARLIMEDSADIQAEDAKWKNKHWKDSEPHEPLYTRDDVASVSNSVERCTLGESIAIHPQVTLRLFEAGHILGSTLVHLTITEGETVTRVAYTGDLGQQNMPLLNPPAVLPETDVLICEATYGNRLHETVQEREDKLVEAVNWAIDHKSKIIVPAFALGRLQTLVYSLHKLTDAGKIQRIPIYVDSPLGTDLTKVFESYPELYDEETRRVFLNKNDDPLGFSNLTYTTSVDESKALNFENGPMMIISSSGMAEAGRVVHHLKHNLDNPNNIVLIVGYMAEGTLGRKILEGEKTVEILREQVPVRARIEHINAFSAHADQNELMRFIKSTKGLKKVILVHGDADAREKLTQKINQEIPALEVERAEYSKIMD